MTASTRSPDWAAVRLWPGTAATDQASQAASPTATEWGIVFPSSSQRPSRTWGVRQDKLI